MVRLRLPFVVLTLALLCTVSAWCLSMAHTTQTVATSPQRCTRLAARAFELEGYGFSPAGGNDLFGSKNSFSYFVCIMCNPAPEGLTQVNIVVAAEDTPAAAQAAADRLQHRIEQLARDRDFDRRR
jgi:hypothetical protein